MWDSLLKKYGEKNKSRQCSGDVDTVGLGLVETHLVDWRFNGGSSVWYTETKIVMGGIYRGAATFR